MEEAAVQKRERREMGGVAWHRARVINGVNFKVDLHELEIFDVKASRRGTGKNVRNLLARNITWQALRFSNPLPRYLLLAKRKVVEVIDEDRLNGRLLDISEIKITPMVAGLLFLEGTLRLVRFRDCVEENRAIKLFKIPIGIRQYDVTIIQEGFGIKDIATYDSDGKCIE